MFAFVGLCGGRESELAVAVGTENMMARPTVRSPHIDSAKGAVVVDSVAEQRPAPPDAQCERGFGFRGFLRQRRCGLLLWGCCGRNLAKRPHGIAAVGAGDRLVGNLAFTFGTGY